MEFKSMNGYTTNENDTGTPDSGASSQPARKTAPLWVALCAVVILSAAFGMYGWNQLAEQRAALDDVARLQEVELIQSEIRSLDERLSTLAGRAVSEDVVDRLASEVRGVESSLDGEIARAREEIAALETALADMDGEIPELIDLAVEDQAGLVRARVDELESLVSRRDEELAGLLNRIQEVRRELGGELAEVERRGDMADRGFENRIGNAERRLDIVAYAVDRDRVDFEMFTDYAEEVSPGIRLQVSDMDRRNQKVSGWIHLVPEGRIVRITEQPIQESFTFYTHQDERSHELVFTRVTETAAVGYMRVPPESLVESADADWTEPSVALAIQ